MTLYRSSVKNGTMCNVSLPIYIVSRHDDYGDTIKEEEICFEIDLTDPDHCANGNGCNVDLISFGNRVRRELDLKVMFDGWFDPEPESAVARASGI